MHASQIFNNIERAIPEDEKFCSVKGLTTKKHLMRILTDHCLNFLFTGRKKMLSRPDGFLLFGEQGFDLICTTELHFFKMKDRVRLITAIPNFYTISESADVSLGIDDCSLYTRPIALKINYR